MKNKEFKIRIVCSNDFEQEFTECTLECALLEYFKSYAFALEIENTKDEEI